MDGRQYSRVTTARVTYDDVHCAVMLAMSWPVGDLTYAHHDRAAGMDRRAREEVARIAGVNPALVAVEVEFR